MGNCNTRLLFLGTNGNTRSMHHSAAPADEHDHRGRPRLMRSTSSEESTFIVFENKTGSPVKLYWLNYEGQKTAYRSIQPGRTHRQQTFLTHPWTFESMEGDPENVVVEHRRVVFPEQEGDRKAVLKEATSLKWSTANHLESFPKKFVESTQAFLLAYNRLRKGYIAAGFMGEDGAPDLGILPSEIILRVIELAAPDIPYILPPAEPSTSE